MIQCLLCGEIFATKKQFAYHIKKHKISMSAYKDKFNLHRYCPTCHIQLPDYNVSGFCNEHRDRTGINNPFFGKTHSLKTKSILKAKAKESTTKLWEDPVYRNKVIANATGKTRSAEFKKEQSERITQWYKDNPQQLEIRSASFKKTWAAGNVANSQNTSVNRSKTEKFIFNEIKAIYPFISTKTVHIGNKYYFPDILIDDTNLIIEYYGDYWHANPRFYNSEDVVYHGLTAQSIWDMDAERINALETKYDVCVIWEYDFKHNKETILKSIDYYLNWGYRSCDDWDCLKDCIRFSCKEIT